MVHGVVLSVAIFIFCQQGVTKASVTEVSYVGCMKRTIKTVLNQRYDTKNDTSMSVQRCVDLCWYNRHFYAGIQDESQCYCTFILVGLTKVPAKECKSRCTGNCYQACGGTNVVSLYKTGYTREPTFHIEKNAFLPAFIGCYDSRTAYNILCPANYKPLWTKRLSIPMCIYYCDAMYQSKFSTVAATDKCCCSDSVHGTRNTVLAWCDFHGTPCDGDKKQGCIGTQEKTLQWSTHQRDRIPNFKRWPKSTFTGGKWLKPKFKVGNKYLMSDMIQPIAIAPPDATLLGLLAKKKTRDRIGADETSDGDKLDKQTETMTGADKRPPGSAETKASAGIVDVPQPVKRAAVEKGHDESNWSIVAAIIVGLTIFLMAVTYFLYTQKRKKQDVAALNAGSVAGPSAGHIGDDTTDMDTGDEKIRRRKKRKQKRKPKKKQKRVKRENGKQKAEKDKSGTDSELPTASESEPLLLTDESSD